MAIYHLSAKMISRSSGRSSVAAVAYRSAERIEDHRQGLEHDYSNRGGVLHTEIMRPETAPKWMSDRSALWNGVEAIEKRKDAQLAREVTVALPNELNDVQRLDLVRGFIQAQFVSQGMVADLAIHAPGAEGDERNHHAHIMLTTRSIEGEGFGKKARAWNAKDALEGWRESWAAQVNHELEVHGHDARIDHRSLEDQREQALEMKAEALGRGDLDAAQNHEIDALELDRDPLPDIGWKAWGMERRGQRTEAGEAWRAAKQGLEAVRALVEPLRARVAEFGRDLSHHGVSGRLAGAMEALQGRRKPEPQNRLGDALASLRGQRDRSPASQDRLRAALKGLKAGADQEAARQRAEAGVLEEQKRRHAEKLERERQIKLETQKKLEAVRKRELEREQRSRHRGKRRGR